MKEKRKLSPLKVDQRIKFDGPCNFANHEVCWGNRTKATIDSVDTLHGKLYIRFSDGDGGTISPRQVVSVLKPKKAPAAPESERVEAWLGHKPGLPTERGTCRPVAFESAERAKHFHPMATPIHLVELRQNEKILSENDILKLFAEFEVPPSSLLAMNWRRRLGFREEREP